MGNAKDATEESSPQQDLSLTFLAQASKYFLIVLFFIMLVPLQVWAQTWTPLGPQAEANSCLAMCPVDNNLLILSTVIDGVWRSEDGGITWSRASAGLERTDGSNELPYLFAYNVQFHPTSRDIVYSLMDDSRLYRSVDAGRSWSPLSREGIPDSVVYEGEKEGSYITSFHLLPDRPNILYAVVLDDSLYKSVDGGSTWRTMNLPFTEDDIYPHVEEIAINRANTSQLYAFSEAMFLNSNDDGQTWESIYAGDNHYFVRRSLVVDPDDGMLYAAGVFEIDYFKGYTVIVSSDSGRHWDRLLFPYGIPEGFNYHFHLNLSPQGEIIHTNPEFYFIRDQGNTWIKFADTLDWKGDEYGNQITKSLVINPLNALTIYAATWFDEEGFNDPGFLWKSIDGGKSFQMLDSPTHRLRISQVRAPTDRPDILYIANGSVLWKSDTRGQDWAFLKTGPFRSIGFFQGNSNVIYLKSSLHLNRSENGGQSWGEIQTPDGSGDIEHIAVHPADSSCIFTVNAHSLWSDYDVIFRSLDGGTTWNLCSIVDYYYSFPYIAFGGGQSDIVFVRTNTESACISLDKGDTWTPMSFPMGPVESLILTTEADGMAVVSSDSLFRTFDGDYYLRMKLPDGVSTVDNLFDNRYLPGMFSITTDLGIFNTLDEGEHWTQVPGSDTLSITRRGLAYGADGILYVATTNNGVWSYDGGIESVAPLDTDIPRTFSLHPPYPNPFNASTTVRFGLPSADRVRLEVFDVIGRHVATLVDKDYSAGWHTVS